MEIGQGRAVVYLRRNKSNRDRLPPDTFAPPAQGKWTGTGTETDRGSTGLRYGRGLR